MGRFESLKLICYAKLCFYLLKFFVKGELILKLGSEEVMLKFLLTTLILQFFFFLTGKNGIVLLRM